VNTQIQLQSPFVLVIFGATGDLARSKLFKALAALSSKGWLANFRVVAFGRRDFDDMSYRQFVFREALQGDSQSAVILEKISYVKGEFKDASSYRRLGDKLSSVDAKEFKKCSNKLFYLAVPPVHYEVIISELSLSGLTIPCGGDLGWTRVLLEKPFGSDLETAKRLDLLLAKHFKEEQIFRIDHYLAKESLQNILAFRFSNSIFEPLWSRKFVERVEINFFEERTVAGRGLFYDGLGALLDVGQNHLLAMLSLIAMKKPKDLSAGALHKERAKVLGRLKIFCGQEGVFRRAQYEGYRSESGVAPDSEAETFFTVAAAVLNLRWRNVPFLLSAGKALNESKVEIRIIFRKDDGRLNQNELIFKIRPSEGIAIKFFAKKPGLGSEEIEEKILSFNYDDDAGKNKASDAYEKVLYDAVLGDQTLFASTAEVSAAWKFIAKVRGHWKQAPLKTYKKGSRVEEI